jgi:hypothetical protein
LADTLSRAPEPREYYTDFSPRYEEEQVHVVVNYALSGSTVKDNYAAATTEDSTLQLVIGLTVNGWPVHKRDCPVPSKQFLPERADLSTAGGLLLCCQQVAVPFSLMQDMLQQIHDGYFGKIKCLERAKSVIYWPGYTKQIINLVAGYTICQE